MSMHILLLEDDDALRGMLRSQLGAHVIREAATIEQAREKLLPVPDVIVADVHLGSESGLIFAKEVRHTHPQVPIIMMTAFGDLSVAIDALRAGAWDFLTKPIDLEVLNAALERASEMHRLRREVLELRRQARMTQPFQGLIGESRPMRELFGLLERIAQVPSSVLIEGESGTGKELVARALHNQSGRKKHPFVPINCAAVPEQLLEGELFGHVRGAFTDAHADRAGLVVQANRGTLFLDEIGDMPKGVQAKLLRVIQERRVRPLGAVADVAVDVRIIAATHRDLDEMVHQERFRQDLLFRLDVFRIQVPPLRKRGTDILLLAQSFITQFAKRFDRPTSSVSPETASQLMRYHWPGNVRELQNCIERAVVLCEEQALQTEHLPNKVLNRQIRATHPPAAEDAPLLPLAIVERRAIEHAMRRFNNHRGKVAEALKIDRKTLYRKLASYDS